MPISFILDPTAENVGTELDINSAPYTVTGFEFPTPPRTPQYASSVDSDGDTLYANRYANRTVTLKLLIRASTDALLTTAITNLQQKAGKINRDAVLNRNGVGGVLKYVTPDGKTRKFDVCEMGADPAFEKTFTARQFVEGTLTFTCLPFWRGDETALSDHTETTLPVLTFTETTVDGDVPALLRLVVDEDQGADQAWALPAVRNRYRTSALTDRLFYQAESLTLLGAGATTSTAASGYSGASSVLAGSLSTSPEAIVSTQMTTAALTSVTGADSTDIFTKASHGLTNDTRVRLSAKTGGSNLSTSTDYYVVNASTGFQLALTMGGTPVDLGSDVSSVTVTPQTHLTHVGSYRVFARVRAGGLNTGTVGVALEWALGDFRRPTLNATAYLTDTRASGGTPIEGHWLLLDLGLVRIPAGSSQWEGRVLASSDFLDDDVYVDYLMITPADEGYAQAASTGHFATPTAYTAREDFGASGSLTGTSLATGGTWTLTSAGGSPSHPDSGDFSMSGGYAQRTTASDDSTDIRMGRWVYASGTSGMTNQRVLADLQCPPEGIYLGVVARAVDRDNFAACVMFPITPDRAGVYVIKVVSGAQTLVNAEPVTASTGSECRLTFTALTSGYYSVEFGGVVIFDGYDADLATSGALDDGYSGIIDYNPTASTTARKISWFYTYAPVPDAACFASQSIEFASDGCTRENTAGTVWAPVSLYEGDLLTVPAGGQEGRTTEFLVKMCRNNPYSGVDDYIDDISARAYVTPRGLVV